MPFNFVDKTNLKKMSKFGRRIKKAPEGYDYIEPTLTALENELRESKILLRTYTNYML